MTAVPGYLEGVHVVALEQAVSLPFATFVMAELGADVVKIERAPHGDVIRGWDAVVDGLSSGFVWLNAGKADIALDLSTPAGRDIALRLAAEADVFVENLTPGAATRLGLDYPAISAVNDRIVYASLSGFGQDGPYRDRKAYDLIVQGESGLLLTNGSPEAPAKIGVPITDLIGGMTLALLVIAALRRRDDLGSGEYLDVAMLDAVLPWLGYYPHHVWHTGLEPPRSGMRHQYTVPYGPYVTADGWINLAVASDQHWRLFCTAVVDRTELAADPRFASSAARTRHRVELDGILEPIFASQPSATWERSILTAGLPVGAVRTVREALQHPQIQHRQMIVSATSQHGEIPVIRFPGALPDRDRHVPRLGEHTAILLDRLGYSPEQITALVERGIVAGHSS